MEIFDEIWGSLRRNKMRTVLTGFAVSWGLFMIIALLGRGHRLQAGDDRHVVLAAAGTEDHRDIHLAHSCIAPHSL